MLEPSSTHYLPLVAVGNNGQNVAKLTLDLTAVETRLLVVILVDLGLECVGFQPQPLDKHEVVSQGLHLLVAVCVLGGLISGVILVAVVCAGVIAVAPLIAGRHMTWTFGRVLRLLGLPLLLWCGRQIIVVCDVTEGMSQLLLCLILLQLGRAVRLHKTHNSEKNSVGWREQHTSFNWVKVMLFGFCSPSEVEWSSSESEQGRFWAGMVDDDEFERVWARKIYGVSQFGAGIIMYLLRHNSRTRSRPTFSPHSLLSETHLRAVYHVPREAHIVEVKQRSSAILQVLQFALQCLPIRQTSTLLQTN